MNRSTFSEFELGARPSEHFAPSSEAGDGLREFLSVLSVSRILIAMLTIAGLLAGVYVALTRAPEYEATAAIILSPGQGAVAAAGGAGARSEPNTGIVESEMELLRSTGMASQLATAAGSARANAWISKPALPLFDLIQLFRRSEMGAGPNEVIRRISESFRVERQQASYVIEIAATSTTPEYAADMANAMAETYLRSKAEDRVVAYKTSSDWLSERLDALKDEVAQKEAAVESYRAEMRLLDINGNMLGESQLASVQTSLLEARGAFAERNARLEQLNRMKSAGSSADSVFAVLSSPVVLELRTREADVAARKADLEQRYGPQHPDVAKVLREYEQIGLQIDAEVGRILTNLGNEVEVARIRVAELERNQSQLEGRMINSNRELVQLRDLERQAAASSELYQQYLTMSRESGEQESLNVVDARIVSLATPSTESSSPPALIWPAFFGAVGLFGGIVLALLRSAMNNRLMRPEDVTRKLGVHTLVSVPMIERGELSSLSRGGRTIENLIVAKPMSRLTESIRVLLNQVITSNIDGGCKVIAVTSALAHEGKTTVATGLGRVAAMSGLRVLLIEGDLRMRSLSKIAPAGPAGLVEALRQEVPWRSVIVDDAETKAQFLPVTTSGFIFANVFATERMQTMLGELRAEYDLIIFDCPPVLAVADARTLSAMADFTLIISRWNKTPAPAVRTALREIENAGGKVVGVVLNCLNPSVVKRISYGDSLYFGAAGSSYYDG